MDTLQRDGRATVAVSPRELEQARAVQAFLAGTDASSAAVTIEGDARQGLTIPTELTSLLLHLLDLVGRGCTVTVGGVPNEVTTTMAAGMLGISRPSLMKLVREGELPTHKVGSHTRLYSKDVLAYRRNRLERQSKAFDELRTLEEEWGVGD